MNDYSSMSVGFQTDTASLAEVAKVTKKIVERRNTIPILSHILFTFRDGLASATGTDLDIVARIEFPCAALGDSSGSFTVEAKAFADAIAKVKGETVTMIDVGGKVELVNDATGARSTLASRSADDFPEMIVGEFAADFELPHSVLRRALDNTRHAISSEETRYYLMGVFLHARCDQPGEPDVLRFAATDGHRLARYTVPIQPGAETMPDVLLPKKAATVAHALLGAKASAERFTRVRVSATKIELQIGRVRLTTKTIDGTFPDYTRVIPHHNQHRVTFDAGKVADTLATVTATSDERTRGVTLSLVAGQKMVASCSSPESGTSAAVVEADIASGEYALGVNARYLTEALKLFDGDVTLTGEDATAPFRIEGESQPGLLLVLMPLRTHGQVMSEANVAKLNMNPMERLMADLPQLARDALTPIGPMPSDTARRPDFIRAARRLRTKRRAALGKAMTAAIAFIASRGKTRLEARLIVKALAAVQMNDQTTYRRSMAYSAWLKGEAGDPVAMPAAPVAAAEPVQEPCPSPEPVAPVVEPEAAPEPVEEASEELPAPVAAEAIDSPPIDAPADEAGPLDVVKVETVYGQVIFVDGGTYRGDGPFVRRVTKEGVPMCEPEAKGGSWKRVLRDNIKREILPRARADQAAAPREPKPDALASRVADLEFQLASIAAMVKGGGVPAATVTPAAAKPERSAARERIVRAYLALRRQRQGFALSNAVLERCANVAQERVAELVSQLATVTAERDEARTMRQDHLGQRFRRVRTALRYRAKASGAMAMAGRLTVRCDALESLAARSATLDRRPAEDAAPSIILPLASRAERSDQESLA